MNENENKGLKYYALRQPYTTLNFLYYTLHDIMNSIFWKEIEISELRSFLLIINKILTHF